MVMASFGGLLEGEAGRQRRPLDFTSRGTRLLETLRFLLLWLAAARQRLNWPVLVVVWLRVAGCTQEQVFELA